MKRCITIVLFLMSLLYLNAMEGVRIQGISPSYAGQTLRLHGYTYFGDGWSGTFPLLDTCTVDTSGCFTLEFSTTHTQKVFLPLGRFQGCLFVEPGHTYQVNLPNWEPLSKADELNPYFQPEEILLSLNELPEHDLNTLIPQFEDAFDQAWINLQLQGPTPKNITRALNLLEDSCPSYNLEFFDEYKTYRYALLVNLYEKDAPNRAIYTFFLDQPVLYHQPSYWEAFEVLFPQFGNISALESNRNLMEAVILQKVAQGDLGIEYLDNLKGTESLEIAQGIRHQKTILSKGSLLDLGTLINIKGDTLIWNELQFAQAYLIFANSYLNESLSDLHYAELMQEKYKDRCLFVIIFDKEPLETTQLTCKNSPQKSFIFSTTNNPQIRAIFEKANIPDYYLVDQKKRLRESPAPQPKDFVP